MTTATKKVIHFTLKMLDRGTGLANQPAGSKIGRRPLEVLLCMSVKSMVMFLGLVKFC